MIVQIKDAIKRYDNDVVALDYLSLNVKRGDVVGLLGPNGAGKTTAINAIVGLLDLDEGDVFVFGEKQHSKSKTIKQRIGLVTQEVTVYEDLNAYENLRFFGRLYNLKGDVLERRIKEVSYLIGLQDKLDVKPKHYSGGMKRRLNIGCALLHEPELIILDEPTVGIDPQSRNYILEFIKRLAKNENIAIIYTSHYIEEVQQIGDYIYIIDQGHIIADGTVRDLIQNMKGDQIVSITVQNPSKATIDKIKIIPEVTEATLRKNNYEIVTETGSNVLDQLLKTLSNETILNVVNKEANLEDVFLTLTGKTLRDGDKND